MGLIIFFCNKPLVCSLSLSQSHIADGMRFQRHDILVLQVFGFVVSSTYARCFLLLQNVQISITFRIIIYHENAMLKSLLASFNQQLAIFFPQQNSE